MKNKLEGNLTKKQILRAKHLTTQEHNSNQQALWRIMELMDFQNLIL